MSDRIEKAVEIQAPVARVWRALTDHREFGAWFRVALDGPFVLGGVTTGRITWPGYEHYLWRATVTAMDEPRLFAFRWPHPADPTIHADDDPTTLVEFRLAPTATGTRLTIVESGFDAVPPERRAEAMRENDKGWTIQAGNIRAHAES